MLTKHPGRCYPQRKLWHQLPVCRSPGETKFQQVVSNLKCLEVCRPIGSQALLSRNAQSQRHHPNNKFTELLPTEIPNLESQVLVFHFLHLNRNLSEESETKSWAAGIASNGRLCQHHLASMLENSFSNLQSLLQAHAPDPNAGCTEWWSCQHYSSRQ